VPSTDVESCKDEVQAREVGGRKDAPFLGPNRGTYVVARNYCYSKVYTAYGTSNRVMSSYSEREGERDG
jgi:hypothetical protein